MTSVMTVKLELTPEVEANLAAQARAHGVPLHTYLQGLIESFARTETTRAAGPHDIEATLDRLAEMGKDLPHLPCSALTRESIYRDHD